MEEAQPSNSNVDAVSPETSLGNRMMNVFIAPAEVFDEIKSSPPRTGNWLMPMILAIVVGWVYTVLVFSQPGVIQAMKDAQARKWQQMVDSGKYTQKQADQIQAMSENFMTPTFLRVVGILGVLISQPALLFLLALIVWLLGTKAFGGNFEYMKAVEVVGMSAMIAVVGAIVSMLLAVIYGSIYMTPGPVLLVGHFDPLNKVHMALSTMNLGSLWYVGVVATGLSRLSGASFLKSALWGFGIWALFTLGPVLAFGGK